MSDTPVSPEAPLSITPFTATEAAEIVSLSLRAWQPVFEAMQPAVPSYVYNAFYPEGWAARQAEDVRALLDDEGIEAFVARRTDAILGWVGLRIHPEDRMGEVVILAVDPPAQRSGTGRALLDFSMERFRAAGLAMAMVETGDDPGHAPSRATYEAFGFERWPVARYFRKLGDT